MKEIIFKYEELKNDSFLSGNDKELLLKAREISKHAYAPYSNFFVGAAALLSNKKIITATNQENASFPAGLCAERVLLSAVASLFEKESVNTIAISYSKNNGKSDHPISPCGICRQSLVEVSNRFQQPIRLILSGQEGAVIIVNDASSLLPLNFSGEELM